MVDYGFTHSLKKGKQFDYLKVTDTPERVKETRLDSQITCTVLYFMGELKGFFTVILTIGNFQLLTFKPHLQLYCNKK